MRAEPKNRIVSSMARSSNRSRGSRYSDRMRIGRASALSRNALLRNAFGGRSEEHTSELQSLMRISYAVFCLKKKNKEQTKKEYPKTRLKIEKKHYKKQ